MALTLALLLLFSESRVGVFSEVSEVLEVLEVLEVKGQESKSTVSKIVINVPARQLQVYSNSHQLLHEYPVGVGRFDFPTPKGEYKIIRKVKNPAWENPYQPAGMSRIKAGKGNPLGTRWLGFKQDKHGEYGIHGTNRPQSVGHFSSHGCVRMTIKDSEELFSLVSVGTPIEVSYRNVWIHQEKAQLFVTLFPNPFPSKTPLSLDAIKQELYHRYPTAKVDEKKLASLLIAQQTQPLGTPIEIGSLLMDSSLINSTPSTSQTTVSQPSTDPNILLDTLIQSQFSDVMKNY